MKKKSAGILILIVGCLILLGSSFPTKKQIGADIIRPFATGDIEFIEEETDSNSAFVGDYIYTDDTSKYYVNINEKMIVRISQKSYDSHYTAKTTISQTQAETIAKDYLKLILGDIIVGDLHTRVWSYDGTSFNVEVLEKIDGIETATYGLIFMHADGKIYSAAFGKGNASYVASLDRSTLISEQQAIDIAYRNASASRRDLDKNRECVAKLRNIKGVICWIVSVPRLDNYGTDEFYEKYSHYQIDAITQEIMEIAEDL